jgi:DNA-binding MarR family transcriptional regulator
MASREEKINATLELVEKTGNELFRIPPKAALEIDLLELTMMQLKLVLFLLLNGPTRMSVLAERLDLGLSTVTGIVDRLVKLELVIRQDDAGDRRIVVCRLTDKANAMINRAWDTVRNRVKRMLLEIPVDKLPLIDQVMELLLNADRIVRQKEMVEEVEK